MIQDNQDYKMSDLKQNFSSHTVIPLNYFNQNINATIIENDEHAIETAKVLAQKFSEFASYRDAHRQLPLQELQTYSQSGLWAITIPKIFGGAEVKYRTLAEVVKIISSVDPSLGQIAQNHWVFLEHIRLDANEDQKQFFFNQVLKGARLGNAFSEKGSTTVADLQTKLVKTDQGYEISGQKFFATGALLAHWIPIVAINEDGLPVAAIVRQDTKGVEIINDWSAFGQRTTASGTVKLNRVLVNEANIIPIYQAFDRPTVAGAISQFIQAAVDAGIAQGAIKETIHYIRQYSRPWIDSGLDKATEDPYTIASIGDLTIKLHAAEALLNIAGDAIDIAILSELEADVTKATLAVAEAKVLTTDIALLSSNKLFELAGTRSTLSEFNLDRYWRNARTHTLHDPVRWKYHIIGNYHLNGVEPPRHPWN